MSPALPSASAPPPVYVPPEEVFVYWLHHYVERHPGQRPPLKWLASRSRLPYSTCGRYRRLYEQYVADIGALAYTKRNMNPQNPLRQKQGKAL